jgi:hypothetical protein
MKNDTNNKLTNNFFPEYSVFLIIKNNVKQTHALLIKMNKTALGSPEETNSLKPCENGNKAFAKTNKTVYKITAKRNFKDVFTINLLLFLILLNLLYIYNTFPTNSKKLALNVLAVTDVWAHLIKQCVVLRCAQMWVRQTVQRAKPSARFASPSPPQAGVQLQSCYMPFYFAFMKKYFFPNINIIIAVINHTKEIINKNLIFSKPFVKYIVNPIFIDA